ncbi:Diadenosine and diphosphoinositol polyphosphate phosphohydrolase [Handroanthus impetiginosus]|uniref:Diadenosine and diphosphoinositol polyphosphate phosphohydrolase n=1 Tax=Handroanthus impetiginosus TaxID=429701 RepID=A0A2G9FWB3_9LAMI|nr:Diadenosine and diphosphoinositol polyphosphate phosphohydrolase [Handroanthus impetiginosus]
MTLTRFLCRPSVLCFATSRTLPFSSKKRGFSFSTSKPLLLHQGRLAKNGFGVFLNIRYSMSSSTSPVLSDEQVQQVDRILEGKNDDHGGVMVEMTNESLDPVVFVSVLRASLAHWQLQVLVVQEKSGRFSGKGIWKFPTGVVDEGEDICGAAVREVKEETGIDAKFVEILAFRQSHKSYFEKSDLVFVCMLQPLTLDIQPQEAEIEAAQWMPFEEYVAQPIVQKHDFLRKIADICAAKMDKGYSGFSPVPTTTGFSDTKKYLYANSQGLDSL